MATPSQMKNDKNRDEEQFRNPIDATRLSKLRRALSGGPVIILTHDNPDPDALASGKGMAVLFEKLWGIPCSLKFRGIVARAENQAVWRLLTPEWAPLQGEVVWQMFSAIVLVDTQPGAGNNPLPGSLLPQVVIDHHRQDAKRINAEYYQDIRSNVGSTSSIVYQYLEAAHAPLDTRLATALFYGIQTDTRGLSRNSYLPDQKAYFALLAHIDHGLLIQIEQTGLSPEYFRAFARGLEATQVYGSVVVAYLGEIHRPDFAAELADLLARLEGARAVLCMGVHTRTLYLSLRTLRLNDDAGLLIRQILPGTASGGGHGQTAGGQVVCGDADLQALAAQIRDKLLKVLKETAPCQPLIE